MVQILNQAQENELLKADRAAIIDAMSNLTFASTDCWLAAAHNAALGVEKEHKPGGVSALSAADLADYLAVAAPTHCADGWGYLSRALQAYILGDAHSAWHFGYYAELRAAQSILSASGCGAFNSWNCVLDSSGVVFSIPGNLPTHVMVWLALRCLSERAPSASASIASATRILGESIPDIVQYAYPGRVRTATSSSWINEWLFDLQSSSEDKSFRNRCSYNPHMATPHLANIADCVEWISSLWQILLPSPGATFMELDKHVVRSVLRREARQSLSLNGNNGGVISNDLVEMELRAAYERILASAPTFSSIPIDFIADMREDEHPLLLHARDGIASPLTPRPVLARATLLLRIATGITQNLLVDANQLDQLGFWLDGLAMRQGIVNENSEIPQDRSDFYMDCAIASEDFEKIYSSGNTTRASLMANSRTKIHLLSQAERVIQWGFSS